MKGIEIAMETELSQLIGKVLAGESIGLTAMLFHEDGYRVLNTPGSSAMTITQGYVGSQDAIAYGLLFEATYQDGSDVTQGCLMMAIVKRDGTAKVECMVGAVDDDGHPYFSERKRMFVDENFLKLFEPLDEKAYRIELVRELVDEVLAVDKLPYSEFIIARG